MLVRKYEIVLYHEDVVIAFEDANLKVKDNLVSRFNKAGKYDLVKVNAGEYVYREFEDDFSFNVPRKHINKHINKKESDEKMKTRLSPVYISKINLYTIRDMGTEEVEIVDGD